MAQPTKEEQPFQSASDVTTDTEFFKVLVVGDYGSGKSVFASSFPTPGFVFDFDKGILTYRGKNFDYAQFPLTAEGYVTFNTVLNRVERDVKEDKYQTVIFDSTTALTDLCMVRALQLDPKRSPTQGPVWNVHYGMVKNLMEGLMRRLINMDCNVVVLAHLELVKDEESGAIVKAQPLLTGQLSVKLPGYFDEVYYAFSALVKGEPTWCLQTVPKNLYKARSRISGKARILPDAIPNDYAVLSKTVKEAAAKAAILTKT